MFAGGLHFPWFISVSTPHHISALTAGRRRPFSSGLQPIDPADWLIFDSNYISCMSAKRVQLNRSPDRFYKTSPVSRGAQEELRAKVVDHLLTAHDGLFCLSDGLLTFKASGRSWDLTDEQVEPLWQLSDFVQEDFMLLEEVDGHQTITAASNAYSSSGDSLPRSGATSAGLINPYPI